jgi:redox-sensitive bicupin YhaK (pirin superfamily)
MIEQVIPARRRDLGGLEVGRVLPAGRRRMVGPFIFFDHIGPAELQAPLVRSMDVRPHPHIGLSTVTYLFAGAITHRDSLGVQQEIRPAEMNWMTAGSGISHSERFDRMRGTGGRLHGIQAWVALPEEMEEADPTFEHFDAAELPMVDEAGWQARIIVGSAFGAHSPVAARSPTVYAHIELQDGVSLPISAEAPEQALFIARGALDVDGVRHGEGMMLLLASGATPTVRAVGSSTVMLLGGEPVGPRYIWWNFVSSRLDRIEQAKADWRAGRIALPVGDTKEIIPLPDDPPPEPHPLS